MNAETRAKAVMDSLEPVLEPLSFYAFNKLEELLSAAITQAENDKLEEAAAHFERYSAAFSGRSFAATLRSLKSKDAP